MKHRYFSEAIKLLDEGKYSEVEDVLSKLKKYKLNSSDNKLLDRLLNFKKERSDLKSPLNKICGIHLSYPRSDVERFAEGGKRLLGFKRISSEEKPSITVITVVYNNIETIEKAIKSVLEQSYSNIEYIVIDGGSSDGTLDVIKQYEEFIDYYVSEKDKGIYDAMNKGLSLAQGSYICFLNADDYYYSYALECSINNVLENNLDLSYANFNYENEQGNIVLTDEIRPWDDSMLIQGIPGGHETILAKSYIFDAVGKFKNEEYRIVADYDWVMRVYKAGFKAGGLNKVILNMLVGGASFSGENEYKENISLLKKNFGNINDNLLEFLYSLKFYKNWFEFKWHDHDISRRLVEAENISKELGTSLARTIENRKLGCLPQIQPKENNNKNKLKIAICLTYIKGVSGGAERIAIEQANKLHEEGHAVTFICAHGKAGDTYYPLNQEIPIIDLAVHPYNNTYFLPGSDFQTTIQLHGNREFPELKFMPSEEDFKLWNESDGLWLCRIFRGFFKSHKFDIVISHMPSTYAYTLLGRIENDPTLQIAMLHNSPKFKFYSDLYPAKNQMDRYLRLVALENADKIGVLFPEFIDQMPDQFKEKCLTIPNFTYLNPVDAKNPVISKKIISVGRLVEQKDHQTLIYAFSEIVKKSPDWQLKIYGDGPLLKPLSEICIKLGLDPSLIFMGVKKNIEEIYGDADIFVLPSLFEGFGLTLLEAMTHGIPVIAFENCEGAKNLITNGDDGYLVIQDGSDRIGPLVKALEELIKDKNKIQLMGKRALSKANLYTIDKNIDILNKVFKDWSEKNKFQIKKKKKFSIKKVALLTTYLEGGAGIATNRLKKALMLSGIDAVSVSFTEARSRDYCMELPIEKQHIYQKCQILSSDDNLVEGGTYFSSSYPGLSKKQLGFLNEFDVINIHWTQNLLTIEDIDYILSLNKPVVWTLHDMNPFTGGCHYSAGCEGYITSCYDCPQMIGKFKDYPGLILDKKAKLFNQSINIVGVSRWIADCAKKSLVFNKNPVHVIPNSLDLDIFTPTGVYEARGFFGLPQNKKIILFSCHDHKEKRKGFKYLLNLAEYLENSSDQYHILTFGNANEDLNKLKISHTSLGHINEEWKLALGYSAADVCIIPSLEDNLPNIILESLACGTPVIAFDNGGINDGVINRVTGRLLKTIDTSEMAEAVMSIEKNDYKDLCRNYAVRHYSFDAQAQSYISLFESLIVNNLFDSKKLPDEEIYEDDLLRLIVD